MFIPKPVSFRSGLIPNKRDLNGLCVKFVPLISGYMHVPLASEDTEVRDIRNVTTVPYLMWGAPLQSPGWGAIVYMHCSANRVFPEAIRQACTV